MTHVGERGLAECGAEKKEESFTLQHPHAGGDRPLEEGRALHLAPGGVERGGFQLPVQGQEQGRGRGGAALDLTPLLGADFFGRTLSHVFQCIMDALTDRAL